MVVIDPMKNQALTLFSGGEGIVKLFAAHLTLSMPGFQKLAQAGGAESASPPLNSAPLIRSKPNLVWANTILWKVLVQNFKCFG